MKTLALAVLLTGIASAQIPFGKALTSGDVTIMTIGVRWSELAKRGIPIAPGAQDAIQVFIRDKSPLAVAYTVTIAFNVDGGTLITKSIASPRNLNQAATLVQFSIGTVIHSVLVESVKITSHPIGPEADFGGSE